MTPTKLCWHIPQAVESPCLSILVPLLVKGLREKAAVVRKTAVIIDNMVKVRRVSPFTLCSQPAINPSTRSLQLASCHSILFQSEMGWVCSS